MKSNNVKSILSGYIRLFSFLGKSLLLIVSCAVFAFLIVWPLWKWATSSPKIYSVVVVAVAVAILLFFIVKKIISSAKNTEEHKFSAKKLWHTLLNILSVLSLVALAVYAFVLVIHAQRLFALFALLGGIVLYGVISFFAKKVL